MTAMEVNYLRQSTKNTSGPFNGVLLCAERVDSKDPDYALQLRNAD